MKIIHQVTDQCIFDGPHHIRKAMKRWKCAGKRNPQSQQTNVAIKMIKYYLKKGSLIRILKSRLEHTFPFLKE